MFFIHIAVDVWKQEKGNTAHFHNFAEFAFFLHGTDWTGADSHLIGQYRRCIIISGSVVMVLMDVRTAALQTPWINIKATPPVIKETVFTARKHGYASKIMFYRFVSTLKLFLVDHALLF